MVAATFLLIYELDHSEEMTSGYNVLDTVYDNMNALPINGIIPIDVGGDCPSGYAVEVLGEWPGTTSGCICEGDDEVHDDIYCLTHSECELVDEQSPVEYTVWSDNTITTEFCVRYVSEYEHTDDSGACPDDMKTCAFSSSCVGVNDDCPFNTMTSVVSSRRNLLAKHDITNLHT